MVSVQTIHSAQIGSIDELLIPFPHKEKQKRITYAS
jgi:hypothetical protein